ncbi:MAG: hypothetical protein EHM61_17895, partial [Acidobacteria bacterium]
MSEMRIVIRDGQREIEADGHGSFAEYVVAALSAEPETIEELDAALERFIERDAESFFCCFWPATDYAYHDAGLLIVDLVARLVVCDSTYLALMPAGSVPYHDRKSAGEADVNYHLSEDWLLTEDSTDWEALAEDRRRERFINPPLDARAVLYGEPLLDFVARNCLDAFHDQGAAAERDYEDPGYQRECDLIREIHVRWMMTPREDLRGQTPRQVMFSHRGFTDASLEDRALQWSRTDRCPTGLNPDSAAYRLAGFGTHEMVVYYDFVREVLWCCRRHVGERLAGFRAADLPVEELVPVEIRRLAVFRDRWLAAPYSDCDGRTAASIIHNERARIPEGETGEEAMIEDDCPLCQMQAELPGPVFWHLDGSHLDDDFAFSLSHETREEWQQERRRWGEFNRLFAARKAVIKRLRVTFPGDGHSWVNPDIAWKMSFSARYSSDEPLPMRLFAIGSQLADLIMDLNDQTQEVYSDKSPSSGVEAELVDRLCRSFADLREGVRSPETEKAEPV